MGWYELYEKEGPEGFKRYRPPTPFDWDNVAPGVVRTRAFLDVNIDKCVRAFVGWGGGWGWPSAACRVGMHGGELMPMRVFACTCVWLKQGPRGPHRD